MKRTAADAAQTRQSILDAALKVFSKNGFNAATLQDIATEANVTRGAVYHHFGSKAALFQELMTATSSGGNDIVADAIAQGGNFIDICERILIRSFTQVATNERVRQAMTLYLFKSDFSAELEAFADSLKQQAVLSVQAIAQYMQMAIGQGELKADVDPAVAARAFIAYQNGIVQLWLLNPEAFSLAESAPELARAFLHGLAK